MRATSEFKKLPKVKRRKFAKSGHPASYTKVQSLYCSLCKACLPQTQVCDDICMQRFID
jgi:hypothetical protein